MAKHNKKRNVGLLHEQLVRHISEKIVNQDQEAADIGVNILEKHFAKGTELYKEFRLFNSLVHTKVDSAEIARRIIGESKSACQSHDSGRLMREKSMLIKDINHNLNEESFYDRRVSVDDYKIFSTVQALLNEWRGKNSKLSPSDIVQYELVLENWLSNNYKADQISDNRDANPLVLNIMIEKFNSKYSDKLNDAQRQILEAKLSKDSRRLITCIKNLKSEGLAAVEKFYESCDNKFLMSKKESVLNKINALEPSANDKIVERALSLAALIEELESEDE